MCKRHALSESSSHEQCQLAAPRDLLCTAQIFFSAHGVPVSYVEQDGDPYKEEMEQCVAMIMARLQQRGFRSPHTLAYQSRVGPVSLVLVFENLSLLDPARTGSSAWP